MSHTPNELNEQFPEYADKIRDLKESDPHFSRLFDEYHVLNHKIHLAETDVKPTSDFHLETLRKQRLAMLDEISPILRE